MKKFLTLIGIALCLASKNYAQCFNVPCFSHISVLGDVNSNYSGNRCFTAYADADFTTSGIFKSWGFLSFYAWQGDITVSRDVDMSSASKKVYALGDPGKIVTLNNVIMDGNDTIFTATLLDITTLNNTGANNAIVLNNYDDVILVAGLEYTTGDTIYNTSSDPVFVTTCAAIPLPVSLEYITYTNNSLRWRSTSELRFSHYEVQASTDGKTWQYLGTVFSNTRYEYVYPVTGYAFYRLKMVEADNHYIFSDIVTATNTTKEAEAYEVYDLSGRRVTDTNLPSGVYIKRYLNGTNEKFISK